MINLNKDNIDLSKIAGLLREGKIIIYPTDTVYGLAGSIENLAAIQKIYEIKERNFKSPLIALLNSYNNIEKIAYIEEKNREKIKKLTEKYWPGALTIILKKKEIVPDIMVSNGDTVGLRVPNLQLSIDIIEACGGVLPTTSANISGEKSPSSYAELSDEIKNRVDIIVDDGACKLGEASTIIDLSGAKPKLIREGAIKVEDLEKIIGEIDK